MKDRGRPKKDLKKESTFIFKIEEQLKTDFQDMCMEIDVSAAEKIRILMKEELKRYNNE